MHGAGVGRERLDLSYLFLLFTSLSRKRSTQTEIYLKNR